MPSTWCRYYTHETYIASISRSASDLGQDYIQKFLKNSWSNLILLHLTNWNNWINGLSFMWDKFCFSTDPSPSSSYKFWEFIFTLLDLWSLFLENLLTILQTFGQVFLCILNSNRPIIKLNLYSYDCTGLLVFGLVHATESLPCSLFLSFDHGLEIAILLIRRLKMVFYILKHIAKIAKITHCFI